jgi:hypothetical protein
MLTKRSAYVHHPAMLLCDMWWCYVQTQQQQPYRKQQAHGLLAAMRLMPQVNVAITLLLFKLPPPSCGCSAQQQWHWPDVLQLFKSQQFNMSCSVRRCLPAVLQVNVSANHLINSARLLSQPSQQHFLQALAPLDVLQATTPVAATNNEHADAAASAQQVAVGAAAAGDAAQQQHAAAPQASATGSSQQQQQQRDALQSQQLQQSGAVDDTAVVTGDDYYAAKDRWAAAWFCQFRRQSDMISSTFTWSSRLPAA